MTLRISGGRKLQSPPGEIARPTASRVRLAVMNLLARELPGCRWLDLCCGSGVMACEAIQRGAGAVVAIEQDRRIAAIAKAGADIIFVESPESIDEFKRIGQELQGTGAWLIANMVPTGRSPELSAKQLKELGFALAIWPGAVMAVAAAATKNALRYLADHGTTAGSPVPMIDMKELHELVGFPDVWEFEKKYVE